MASNAVSKAPAAAAVTAGVTTLQIVKALAPVPVVGVTPAAVACALAVPGGGRFDSRKLTARVSGNIFTNTTATATIGLYAALPSVSGVNLLTVGNLTLLRASTARSVVAGAATGCPFFMEATLLFDSASGNLNGSVSDMINNSVDAAAAVSNVLGGINDSPGSVSELAGQPAFNLVVGVTFSVADVLSTLNVVEFELDF